MLELSRENGDLNHNLLNKLYNSKVLGQLIKKMQKQEKAGLIFVQNVKVYQ